MRFIRYIEECFKNVIFSQTLQTVIHVLVNTFESMKGDVASRRRRHRTVVRPNIGLLSSSPNNTTEIEKSIETIETPNEDYYDDGSDSDSKGNRGFHDEKMYRSSCSFGQFVLNPCHCLFQYGQSFLMRVRRKWNFRSMLLVPLSKGKHKHKRQRHGKDMAWIDLSLLGGMVTFSLVTLYVFLHWIFPISHSVGRRPATDDHVNRIPLLLPSLDFQRWKVDIGGWQFFHHFFLPENNLLQDDISIDSDYDEIEFVGRFGKPRVVRPDEAQVVETYLENLRGRRLRLSKYAEYDQDVQDEPEECRRQNWTQMYNPSCNAIHEIDLSNDFELSRERLGYDQLVDTFYINHGYWRDVWVVDQLHPKIKSVLKMSRWKHSYNIETFWYTLRDALVMERLSKSPRIVDIFGHCGFAVWVEAIPYEVEEVIVPDEGFIKQEDLHDEVELQPKNNYNDEERLRIALTMAESIADLHGFEDGLM